MEFFARLTELTGELSGLLWGNPLTLLVLLGTGLYLTLRMGLTTLPTWQIWLSVIVQALSVIVVMWVAAKAFRLGMLMYGKRLTPRALWQALREGRVGPGDLIVTVAFGSGFTCSQFLRRSQVGLPSSTPRSTAALMMASSMPRSPARNMAMTNPVDCQTAAMTTQ